MTLAFGLGSLAGSLGTPVANFSSPIANSISSPLNSLINSVSKLSGSGISPVNLSSNYRKFSDSVVKSIGSYTNQVISNAKTVQVANIAPVVSRASSLVSTAQNAGIEVVKVASNLVNLVGKSTTTGQATPVMVYSAGGQQYALYEKEIGVPVFSTKYVPGETKITPASISFTTSKDVQKLGVAETVAKYNTIGSVDLANLNKLLGELDKKHFDFEKYISELRQGKTTTTGPVQLSTLYGKQLSPEQVGVGTGGKTTAKLPATEEKITVSAKVTPSAVTTTPGRYEVGFTTVPMKINVFVPIEAPAKQELKTTTVTKTYTEISGPKERARAGSIRDIERTFEGVSGGAGYREVSYKSTKTGTGTERRTIHVN